MTDPRLEPPDTLNDDAKRIWRGTLEQLLAAGTIRRVDHNSLLAYVTHVQDLNRAITLIQASDLLLDRDGKPIPNPALAIKDQASQGIARFARQFQLNRVGLAPVNAPDLSHPEGTWFCDRHKQWHGRCHKTDGSPCHQPVMIGLAVCAKHGGKAPQVQAAHALATERRNNPLQGEPMDIAPGPALLWRVGVLSGELARLDAEIYRLQGEELFWGKTTEVEDDSGEFAGRKTTYGARLHLALQLRTILQNQLRDAAEACARANVEDRIVRLAEQQGAVMHKVILTALAMFGIAPDDPRIPEVMPLIIRELTAA